MIVEFVHADMLASEVGGVTKLSEEKTETFYSRSADILLQLWLLPCREKLDPSPSARTVLCRLRPQGRAEVRRECRVNGYARPWNAPR